MNFSRAGERVIWEEMKDGRLLSFDTGLRSLYLYDKKQQRYISLAKMRGTQREDHTGLTSPKKDELSDLQA